jgi:L-ascorbate metabolism protein UlaG (beta-lactamase superfamily)
MPHSRDRSNGPRDERIRASPRFNGRVFVNTHPVAAGFKEGVERPTLRDFLCGGERRIPSGPLPLVNPVDAWERRPASGLRATWLGHSTLLIEIDGVRLLTDPVWSSRASPMPFAGPRRFHPPPVPLDALPPLDAVLLSHDHYDHLDRAAVRTLARRRVPFIASLGVGAHLERWGVPAKRVTELDWWEQAEVGGVTVTAGPAQHFSGRGLKDRNATLWSSFHLRGPRHSFFHGADSGLTPEYGEIAQRFGPFDAVTLEIGAWHPAWGDIHLGPANAVKAYAMLGSGVLLPIHWGTFNLAMHAWDEPAETVLRLGRAAAVPLVMPRIGEPVEPAKGPQVDPWWRTVSADRAPEVGAAAARAAQAAFDSVPD